MVRDSIENPIINSPYAAPTRHFNFADGSITSEIVTGRRKSSYRVPVAKPRSRGRQAQLVLDVYQEDEYKENDFINQIRNRLEIWRSRGYPNITNTTRRLLQYWNREERRDTRLYFCQREAIETAIYITEAAKQNGDAWIENDLLDQNRASNPDLYRIAFKMATGSGKTVVMAMLIAWQVLNKCSNRQDSRFSDTFLIVTPGLTIKDRLRVLYPNDPENYYQKWDLVPEAYFDDIQSANILVTNFHSFLPRETMATPKLTKQIIYKGKERDTKESPARVVQRVCREFLSKKGVIVINDEGHHCYRRKIEEAEEGEELKGEEKQDAQKRDEYARIWISGLEAVQKKLGIRVVYDLSATPFFLKGSGYKEGTLFSWVVSDFSLVDAIECGVVKIPRVPVSDDQMVEDIPKYRHIWPHVKDDLPKKGRGTKEETGEPKLKDILEAAIHSLYSNYVKYFEAWQKESNIRHIKAVPPVFIVVCNNTNVSKIVFDYISGWEKQIAPDMTALVPGKLELFSNVEDDHAGGKRWRARPYSILVDSEQLESGEALSPDFRKIARAEIDQFKDEFRRRSPEKDIEKLSESEILREVMNTVGKPGKLGEHVRCVVSVSMLTEGWDANTVTHILGIRAFGTQLLCEQVVGRALRRMSFDTDENGHFSPEYAEVYGVPFSFMSSTGTGTVPVVRPFTRVKAMPEREACEIRFPRVAGYRYEIDTKTLPYRFTTESKLTLSTENIPTVVENAPLVGEVSIHKLDDLLSRREQEVIFLIAKLTLERYFRQDSIVVASPDLTKHRFTSEVQTWYFPQILDITRLWVKDCVKLKDKTFIQMLLLLENAYRASDRIYNSIVHGDPSSKRLMPILHPYNAEGTTKRVDFETTKPVYSTAEDRCHVTHVVGDTKSWEQKMARVFEDDETPEFVHYVKNENLGFMIPYTLYGEEKQYYPDFIVHVNDGQDDYLNLVVEVTGVKKKDKEAKVDTALKLWVPAVNNHGGFGRWAFFEVRDPWNCMDEIRVFFNGLSGRKENEDGAR